MTATVEPGQPSDWEDTGPIPLYTRPSGDTARWRDRGLIIAALIAERDEARAKVRRVEDLADRLDARFLHEDADAIRRVLATPPNCPHFKARSLGEETS